MQREPMYHLEAKELGVEPGSPLHEWSSISVVGHDLDAALLRVTTERMMYSPGTRLRFRLRAPDGTVVDEHNHRTS